MPNIIEYTSKSGLTPSDKGINAAVDAAVMFQRTGQKISSDIERTFNKISDRVERHMAIMETSELYKTGTELRMNLEKRYEEESALPENRTDPTFGDRFMAEVGPLLDQWGEGAGTDHGKQLAATLKAGIRNQLFNHVAAGQAEMDSAHVQDNIQQTGNMLGSGLITDPSASNLTGSIATMKASVDAMTMTIPDVRIREDVRSQMLDRYLPQLVLTRYNGVAEAIKNQIAETGGETSPALEQLNKDIAAQVGFQYLTPETQSRLTKLGEQAVSQGQELFNSRNATAKAQAVEAGNAAYAEIHSAITAQSLKGEGPTPDQVAAIQQFSATYGATNSGQVAALNNFLLQGQNRAIENKVQPFDQQTRDRIQTGFGLPVGDPRRPTLASLMQDFSKGRITADDLKEYTGILDKLDHPEKDPSFSPAFQELKRWQGMMVKEIGRDTDPGAAAARAQFIHDSTANFMALGRASGDWTRTLDRMTDAKNPGSFINFLDPYKKIAKSRNAPALIARDLPTWNPDNTLTWPKGTGGGRPAAPAPAAPAKPITPAADLQKADEILWGKQ